MKTEHHSKSLHTRITQYCIKTEHYSYMDFISKKLRGNRAERKNRVRITQKVRVLLLWSRLSLRSVRHQ